MISHTKILIGSRQSSQLLGVICEMKALEGTSLIAPNAAAAPLTNCFDRTTWIQFIE
jgi:hypothetical protein